MPPIGSGCDQKCYEDAFGGVRDFVTRPAFFVALNPEADDGDNAPLHGKLAAADLIGEPGGIRTHDPMIKSHVLYQLSYGLANAARMPLQQC